MHTLSRDVVKSLIEPQSGPCLSLYQRTHRSHPDNAGDPIKYKNLLRQLSNNLDQTMLEAQRDELLAPLMVLADDRDFWNHTLDGLAILRGPDFLQVFALPRPVPDLAIVSDSWHIKPLLRHTQTMDRYQVLCLTRDRLWLCEGNRHEMHEIEMAPDVPRTIKDALGDQLTAPYQKVSSYGLGPAGGPGSAMHHGHGDRSDELEVDTPRFFRVVDQAVQEHHSKPSGLPLILASLAEHQTVFRNLSSNPALLPEGIRTDPGLPEADALRAQAWEIVEPHYHSETRKLIDRFHTQHGTGLASDNLEKTALAATEGRIDTLLVDADRTVPGVLDPATGKLALADSLDAYGTEDVLDDLAEIVLRRGGDVMVLPTDVMPSDTGVAALFRY